MLEFPVSGKHKDRFEDILVENDYMNDINLKNVTLDQAMNSKVWQGIKDSWTDDVPYPNAKALVQKKS